MFLSPLQLLWKLKWHKWPSCLSWLSADTFPGRGSTAMLELAQWCSALPLPASKKQTHLTSHTQYKAQPAEAPGYRSPLWLWGSLSAAPGPHSVHLHTHRWDVGGRLQPPQRTGSLLLSCPPQNPSPRIFPSWGWEPWITKVFLSCIRKWREPLRPGQEKQPWRRTSWSPVLSDKSDTVVGWPSRCRAAPWPAWGMYKCKFASVQTLALPSFLLCQEYSVSQALPFLQQKRSCLQLNVIPSSLLIISPGNLNVPLISVFAELNIYTKHIYKYI